MNERRLQVVASIGTRLALGAFPLLFIITFGWVYGKQAFDVAAAAVNWANYLNLFLLSGFALVPPAVARLHAGGDVAEADRASVRDHIVLERYLIIFAAIFALALGATIESAFPALATAADAPLTLWFAFFAVLAISQLPLTLWLGIAQAAGHYGRAMVWVAVPRFMAVAWLLAAVVTDVTATVAIAVSVTTVLAGQIVLVRIGRSALRSVDPRALDDHGRADAVLSANFNTGLISFVATLVTIAPVTLVGRVLPELVGVAHVLVTLSNAFGAVVVAAFFPVSLALAGRTNEGAVLRAHCVRVARGVVAVTGIVVIGGWLLFPICSWLRGTCTLGTFAAGSMVIAGAGLRLGSLGVYHGALLRGRPHVSLISAIAEALVVAGLAALLIEHLKLVALGFAFLAGGAVRFTLALTVELRVLLNERV